MAELHQLQTVRTDSEIAKDIRSRLEQALLKEIGPLCDEAAAAGLQVSFTMGMGPFGKNIVQQINIFKVL